VAKPVVDQQAKKEGDDQGTREGHKKKTREIENRTQKRRKRLRRSKRPEAGKERGSGERGLSFAKGDWGSSRGRKSENQWPGDHILRKKRVSVREKKIKKQSVRKSSSQTNKLGRKGRSPFWMGN